MPNKDVINNIKLGVNQAVTIEGGHYISGDTCHKTDNSRSFKVSVW